MKTFVIGDIHGAYKALLNCLELSHFDRKKDRLICLGDVCDRGDQVKECITELLTIPGCVYILGNHDAWTLEWANNGKVPLVWSTQGGKRTIQSYGGKPMPKEHAKFLTDAKDYYVEKNRLFVHGGFDPQSPVEETPQEVFLWDRSLLERAEIMNLAWPDHKFGPYDEVFVGHTPTTHFGKEEPQKFCNVWAMDTGAGHGAKLTIMDVETKQFWQSKV